MFLKRISAMVAALSCGAVLSITGATNASATPGADWCFKVNHACLFENADFEGRMLDNVQDGVGDLSASWVNFNDISSSIINDSWSFMCFYEHAWYKGSIWPLGPGDYTRNLEGLASYNDSISSAQSC